MIDLITDHGFLYFINDKNIVDQLIDTNRLYSKIKRKWDRTSCIIFLLSKKGVYIQGYGSVDFVLDTNELTGLEQMYCTMYGYKQCIGFKRLNWLTKLVQLNDFMKIRKIRYGYLHGIYLEEDKLDEILDEIDMCQ